MLDNDAVVVGDILSAAFMLAGTVASVCGVRNFLRARESNNWPSVYGTIRSSKIVRRLSPGDPPGYSKQLEVAYEYVVHGRRYISSRAGFGMPFAAFDRFHNRRLRKQHRPGKLVTVYYDPKAPEFAVLQKGNDGMSVLAPIIGLMFAVVGIALFCILRASHH